MILIFTGPDKTGKSSLIEAVCKRMDNMDFVKVKCVNRGRRGNRVAYEVLKGVLMQNKEKNFIFDRFQPIDGRIYAPVIEREPCIFDKKELSRIEDLLNSLQTTVIITTADNEVVKERYNELQDDYVTYESHIELVRGFKVFAEITSLPIVWQDTSTGTAKQNAFELLQKI